MIQPSETLNALALNNQLEEKDVREFTMDQMGSSGKEHYDPIVARTGKVQSKFLIPVATSKNSDTPRVIDTRNFRIDCHDRERQRKLSNPTSIVLSNDNQFSFSNFHSFMNNQPQGQYYDRHFREFMKSFFRRKPSTYKVYQDKISVILQHYKIKVPDNISPQEFYTIFRNNSLSTDQLENWLFSQFFTRKRVAWSTIDGYLSAVKAFYQKQYPEYFSENGDYQSTRNFLKQNFKSSAKRQELLEWFWLKSFLNFLLKEAISPINSYSNNLAVLGTLFGCRISDIDRIDVSRSGIFEKISFSKKTTFIKMVISGSKTSYNLEDQIVSIPIQESNTGNHPPLNLRSIWNFIIFWRGTNQVFGKRLFSTPKKITFSTKRHNILLNESYHRWKSQDSIHSKDFPLKITQDFLRKSMIQTCFSEFNLSIQEIQSLTRHKSTSTLSKNYLSHWSVKKNSNYSKFIS